MGVRDIVETVYVIKTTHRRYQHHQYSSQGLIFRYDCGVIRDEDPSCFGHLRIIFPPSTLADVSSDMLRAKARHRDASLPPLTALVQFTHLKDHKTITYRRAKARRKELLLQSQRMLESLAADCDAVKEEGLVQIQKFYERLQGMQNGPARKPLSKGKQRGR